MEEVINFDQRLLLALNGSESEYVDNFFLLVTKTSTWIPLVLVLLYILFKNRPWREVLFVVVSMAVLILITDRFSSGFCKPFFHRFRPSHEPMLEGLVDLVEGRRGSLYGFISSHAANTFGVCTFLSLYFRQRLATFTLILWACLSSYSRVYLGLHYPGDIFAGALFGLLAGGGVYGLLLLVSARWLEPLRPEWPIAPTLLGYNSNPDGFEPSDSRLLLIAFLLTLFLLLFISLF